MTALPSRQRIYFVDGPARGRSMLTERLPTRLAQSDGDYRRVRHFRSTHFYRHVA
jgi:hypothetical protein